MNQYGAIAENHWRRWKPESYAELPDPERFFTELGEEIATRIDEVALELEGAAPSNEDFLMKAGRLREARLTAESQVLREMALLEPDPGHDEEDEEAPSSLGPSYRPAMLLGAESNELTPEQEAEAQKLYDS